MHENSTRKMQAVTSLAGLLVWDCSPESVSCRFKVVTAGVWEADVKQPLPTEGRRSEEQTRGAVCSSSPMLSAKFIVQLYRADQQYLQTTARCSAWASPQAPPKWNHSGGWMCLAYRFPDKFQLVHQLQWRFLCPSNSLFLQTFTSPVLPTNTPGLIPLTTPFPFPLTVTMLPGWYPKWHTLYKTVPTCDFNSINICVWMEDWKELG